MKNYRIAVPVFPGSNGEVDNVSTLRRCGFDAFLFRWNDSVEKLRDVHGYFMGAGFSYEDRGRSGMVAARDPLFTFLHDEAAKGKVIIGNCNGAQVLVESGLIPLGDKLRMSLAHNIAKMQDGTEKATGFLNEWVWIQRVCAKGRCATANWDGVLHVPYAHGEGRFVTVEQDLLAELKANDQIAFQYADQHGDVSPYAPITPNGSTEAIAGICNKEGNVVALMPHPERTPLGDAYFTSLRLWLDRHPINPDANTVRSVTDEDVTLDERQPMEMEIFIDTIITNNEERTVEQAARRMTPKLTLKQYRYVGMKHDVSESLLSDIAFFNPNKEIAYARKDAKFLKWNEKTKSWDASSESPLAGISLLRRDLPDMKGASIGDGIETGVLYDCRSIDASALCKKHVLEVFGNPHSSVLHRVV